MTAFNNGHLSMTSEINGLRRSTSRSRSEQLFRISISVCPDLKVKVTVKAYLINI